MATSLDSCKTPEQEENVGNSVESSQRSLTMSCENVEEEVEGEAGKKKTKESQNDKAPKETKKSKEMAPRSNPNKINDNKQPTLQATTDVEDSSNCALVAGRFDPEKIIDTFAEMIIMDGLSFAFSEKSGFKKLMPEACPRFTPPSRRTIIRDCVRIYYREKEKLKKFFIESSDRVSLTTDTWTSMQQQSYCVLRLISLTPIGSYIRGLLGSSW